MKTFLLTICLSITFGATAQGEDASAEKSLTEVTDMLLSPEQRKKVFDSDEKAKQADDLALQVGGNAANQQKIYELSAQIMKDLAAQGKNDPDVMAKLVEDAKKDPEGFAKKFTPEQQKMLQDLAAEIERTQGATKIP